MNEPPARPYDDKTDDWLMNELRKAFFDACFERPFSVKRFTAWMKFDSLSAELARRAALVLNKELGLPEVDLWQAAPAEEGRPGEREN